MISWPKVDWSKTLGGNDKYGDCTFVSLANLLDIRLAPQIVAEGEIERFYSIETGFNPTEASTDKGAVLEAVIRDWCKNGWPSDPTLKPIGYSAIAISELPSALNDIGGAPAWMMLPLSAGGEDYDFSDNAMVRNAPGKYAHAILIVASGNNVTFITWTKAITVSMNWWLTYGRQIYRIEFGDNASIVV